MVIMNAFYSKVPEEKKRKYVFSVISTWWFLFIQNFLNIIKDDNKLYEVIILFVLINFQ